MSKAGRAIFVVGLLAAAVLTATLTAALPAGAAGKEKVGPKQYFTGVINGQDGNTTTPIVIRMNCVNPVSSGETGHPQSGQTLAVHQEFPPTAASSALGYTGNDSEIGFFTAPPPSVTSSQPASQVVIFKRYDKTQPLPTTLTFPCSGGGHLYFVPLPAVPPSQPQSVPVDFVTLVP
jgi:hypothetical protein